MSKRIIVISLATAVSAVGFIIFFFSGSVTVDAPPSVRFEMIPDLSLKNFSGEEVRLRGILGKPAVINAWATWCPFCLDELVDFAKIREEYKDELIVAAINRGETLETAQRFLDKAGIGEKLTFLLDKDDYFYKSIGGFSMPETIFVDAEGNIRYHRRGPMKLEEMRRRIQQTFGL